METENSEKEKEKDKDLVVDVAPSAVNIALLENHRLIEYSTESTGGGEKFSVGDVCLGKVRKILPNLNAAYVDIGDRKDAFVHYLDLGLYFKAFDRFVKGTGPQVDAAALFADTDLGEPLPKEGSIAGMLTPGQPIMVQIVKEPISTKGSRVTAEISIAGRNIVLLPFADKVSISQRIVSKEERRRLESLVRSILPKNYGAVIRTASEGKNAATLVGETKSLLEKWQSSWAKLAEDKKVKLLFSEYSKTTTILRDLLNDSFTNIWVNEPHLAEELRQYVALIAPGQEKIVHVYDGKQPIYDHFEVTRQIKSSFGRVVSMRQGAYLVIESTEALNVIDVNSGIRTKTKDQEENSFEVNKIAAEEIARQLRLRDMGGIVIVDFIDMEDPTHRATLYKYMKELMEDDRAKHNVLPLTKFGLMQITRQRKRPVTVINTTERCPVCQGTGKIHSSVVIDEEIERQLDLLVREGKSRFQLRTSPILGAYLRRGWLLSYLSRWRRKHHVKISLQEDTGFSVLQYQFFDEKGEKLG